MLLLSSVHMEMELKQRLRKQIGPKTLHSLRSNYFVFVSSSVILKDKS